MSGRPSEPPSDPGLEAVHGAFRWAPRLRSTSRWVEDQRHGLLVGRISRIVRTACPSALRALDVGANDGSITVRFQRAIGIPFDGIEPSLAVDQAEANGIVIRKGRAETIPFPSESFDVVLFLAVIEHIPPQHRVPVLRELRRVLRPGGVVVGEMPNMYHPIESHSRLPFQQYLPRRLGLYYYRAFSPTLTRGVPMDEYWSGWYRVAPRDVRLEAHAAGFSEARVSGVVYPESMFPGILRIIPMTQRAVPLSFDFVLRK